MQTWNEQLEVVRGEGGGDAEALVVRVTVEGEDAEGAAELGVAEQGGLGFAEGAELASAALDDVGGDLI